MRLSEAIRLGAMMKPQAFNEWQGRGSCALRAAADAVGVASNKNELDYGTLLVRFPLLKAKASCPCPFPDGYDGCDTSWITNVTEMVWHLNDQHKWTREAIADLVATIEQQQEAQLAEEPVCISVSKK